MSGRIAISMPAIGGDGGGSVKAHKIRTRVGVPVMMAVIGLALAGCAPRLEAQEQPKPVADPTPMTSSPLGHYLAARQAQTDRRNGEAADLLAVTLANDPNNPELLNVSFLLLASEGRLAEAAQVADHIQQVEPGSPTAGILLAWRDIKKGDLKAADAHLAKLPDEGVNKIIVPMVRAWLAEGTGQTDSGLAQLDHLKVMPGLDPIINLHRALIEDQAGRTPAADADYGKLVAAEAGTLRVVQLVGNFYQRQGRKEEAKKLYADFIENNSETTVLEPDLKTLNAGQKPAPIVATVTDGVAESFFNIASLLAREQITDTAMVFERIALDLKPNYPIAQTLLAELLINDGRTRDAITVYHSISADSPFSSQARNDEARALDDLGQTDKALGILDAMIAERPDRYDAATAKGNILRSHEHFPEAAQAYDVAISRIPELKRRHWSLLYFRGIALERSKQWPLAEKDFQKALELEPEQPYVMNYLAYSWVERREHLDEAFTMLKRAVELKPQDGFIVDSLGWAYYRQGQYDKAVEYLERAVELEPVDATINDHLGDAYWRAGRKTEARYQWQRSLQFGPEPDHLEPLQAKIKDGLGANPSGS
jgi:tetratricopeptide (TPR) repeat protein